MQTSNTEEMVTISRAEYERLQQEKARNAKLEAKLAAREQEQAQVITSLTLQNEWLLEQLKLSKKKLFGRSSEQAEQMVMDQLSLTYNELEAYAFGTKAATEKQITVKAHERKRQSGRAISTSDSTPLALGSASAAISSRAGPAIPARTAPRCRRPATLFRMAATRRPAGCWMA